MRILKQEDISNWSYEHTCDNCNSQLEVCGDDLKYYESRDEGCFYTNCVVCSAMFTIPSDKVPKLLKVEVMKRRPNYGGGYFDR